jgi:hypothetical protein
LECTSLSDAHDGLSMQVRRRAASVLQREMMGRRTIHRNVCVEAVSAPPNEEAR